MARAAVLYLQAHGRGAHDDAGTARALASRHGLEVVAVVRAPRARHHGPAAPPGGGAGTLGTALSLIAQGRARVLLCPRLEALAAGLRELVALLDWLQAAGAQLVALDVDLDTASPAGCGTVRVLRELARLEHQPPPGRPGRGRPGLAQGAPELAGRIVTMRERGLSMQAIADVLNAQRVPTRRGGTQWRPSSVQAALGYRRPQPPLAGIAPAPGPAPPAAGAALPAPPPPKAPPRAPRPPGPPRPRDARRGPGGPRPRKS